MPGEGPLRWASELEDDQAAEGNRRVWGKGKGICKDGVSRGGTRGLRR